MMRVAPETRERLMKVAAEDFGGVTADEAVVRLLDIYWQTRCVAAVDDYFQHNPEGWAEYLYEAEAWDAMSAPIAEPWDERA